MSIDEYELVPPCWVSMIQEMQDILGFSLARIAYRIGRSRSSVQKLVKDFNRTPRDTMFFNLACYYHKLFYSEYALPKAKKYAEDNQDHTLYYVVIELLNRGFLEDFSQSSIERSNRKKIIEFARQNGFRHTKNIRVGSQISKTAHCLHL